MKHTLGMKRTGDPAFRRTMAVTVRRGLSMKENLSQAPVSRAIVQRCGRRTEAEDRMCKGPGATAKWRVLGAA